MTIENVLVVDDEPDIRDLLKLTLARMNLNCEAVENIEAATEALAKNTFDLCLTDMNLPDGNGILLVEHVQKLYPSLPIAVITAYGSMDTAVEALKAGAYDFVSKPVDLNRLRELVQTALKLSKPPSPTRDKILNSNILGNSDSIIKLRTTIKKLARSQAPVYIHGESGTGKELVAREIHNLGQGNNAPFIAVNCGAIPSELMESEFFGHKKGSFTGAATDKDGLFIAANGGTLFLDEVADLPLSMQVKLLRAIQERVVRPIGAHAEQSFETRILCATHKDLNEEVISGRFRQDLYYRLNVIEIDVPALRKRRGDIPLLANYFLNKITQSWDLDGDISITPTAMEKLSNYDFPGNVRELENILERSITLAEGDEIDGESLKLPDKPFDTQEIDVTDFRAEVTEKKIAARVSSDNLDQSLESKEREQIMLALEATRWNKTAAAKKLGITFRQLRYRLKKLNID